MARNALAALIAVVAVGGTGLAWLEYASSHDPRYASVVSISRTMDFQDPAVLDRAWALPVAAAYRHGGYEYQANPSFCGPASAANVLHSEGVSATQRSVLSGSDIHPIFGLLLPRGITLDQEAALLRTSTRQRVTVLRDLSLGEFRAQLPQANDLSRRYIVNFHRGPLFGMGHGHFSPILGYLADEDLVFVGDVNHDYMPFVVSSARLFDAMNTVDSASGLKRGMLVIDADVQQPVP
jgi:Phytochelatin synthase